ncbi:hypothetical protein [Kordia zhangzhouensis]|uniref:hypothetical protein n=1 Tax=Kordia zhangzhouensis TaxID=1620405 RepID=UPI000629C705|nr:hypothetical protein [Kordia zhangzhouensis]
MEAKDEKLNAFTKEIIQDAGLQVPSEDFLKHVMAEVSKEKVTKKVYKPLISKVGWMLIGSLFVVFTYVLTRFSLGFSFFGNWNLTSLWVEKYKITFSIPTTYAYSFAFLLVFVIIQVYLFSKRFSKSLDR